jgi:acetyl-CoA C-acetyltransferase
MIGSARAMFLALGLCACGADGECPEGLVEGAARPLVGASEVPALVDDARLDALVMVQGERVLCSGVRIAIVEIEGKKGKTVVVDDEEPFTAPLDKMRTLKPAFLKDGGTVTAANASKINDGAAAMVVTSADYAEKNGLKPIARIIAQSTAAHEPEWFTTAPGKAIDLVLQRANLTVDDIDLFEINEAFAAVALAAMKDANIPHEKLNVHGGAVALGHPIGASGARILVTLIHALQDRGGKRGMAAICIGGGEAAAMIVEVL